MTETSDRADGSGAGDGLRRIAPSDLPIAVPRLRGGAAPKLALPPMEAAEPVCPLCDGSGWYKLAVPLGHPEFAQLKPCACKQRERQEREWQELRRISNLAAFQSKTFETFAVTIPGVHRAVQSALAFARTPAGWLSFFGNYGCGKTHLAAAIANAVLLRREPVLFVVVPDLLDHLRATYGPLSTTSYDELFQRVRTVPLLVLDDLGTEDPTPWAKEKLYQIVNHRYNEALPTVFTTNLRPHQIDSRVYSRMCDHTIVEIPAADYRQRNQRSTTERRPS